MPLRDQTIQKTDLATLSFIETAKVTRTPTPVVMIENYRSFLKEAKVSWLA